MLPASRAPFRRRTWIDWFVAGVRHMYPHFRCDLNDKRFRVVFACAALGCP